MSLSGGMPFRLFSNAILCRKHGDTSMKANWCILFSLIIVALAACTYNVGYSPPAIPLKLVLTSNGEITLEASAAFVTPLGVFEVGTVSDPYTFFDTIQNTLTIRTDSYECLYDLRGQNFEIEFGETVQARSIRKDSANNIVLELSGNYAGCQQTLPVPAHQTTPDCQPAYDSRLQLGQQAAVAVFQVSVRTAPGASNELVRNKYLKKGRIVTILEGPECAQMRSGEPSWWWKVKSQEIKLADGQKVIIVGWVDEKEEDNFLLSPR
jgi:hypothetical protein